MQLKHGRHGHRSSRGPLRPPFVAHLLQIVADGAARFRNRILRRVTRRSSSRPRHTPRPQLGRSRELKVRNLRSLEGELVVAAYWSLKLTSLLPAQHVEFHSKSNEQLEIFLQHIAPHRRSLVRSADLGGAYQRAPTDEEGVAVMQNRFQLYMRLVEALPAISALDVSLSRCSLHRALADSRLPHRDTSPSRARRSKLYPSPILFSS